MSTKGSKPIYQVLKVLGLDEIEINIFLILSQKGQLTILQLARRTKIPRTSIYRYIEKLESKGLVDKVIGDDKSYIKALSFNRLELLVKKQQSEIEQVSKLLPTLAKEFRSQDLIQQPETKVIFFRGTEGIKQMAWNVLSAKTEILGYTFRPFESILGPDFYFMWQKEFIARKKKGRDIYSSEELEIDDDTHHVREKWIIPAKDWKTRFIKPSLLDIKNQLDIYDDVTSFYRWYEDEVFGVELHNIHIAQMQRDIFEILWKLSS